MWNGAACAETVNFVIAEAELLQHFFIVLTQLGSAPGRNFGDAMHFQRTADGKFQALASAFKRHDDLVCRLLLEKKKTALIDRYSSRYQTLTAAMDTIA